MRIMSSRTPQHMPNKRTSHSLAIESEPLGAEALQVLGAIGDAVVVTRLDGTIVFCNEAARVQFGWDGAEVLDRPVRELLAGARPEVVTALTQRVLTGEPVHLEHPLIRRDGERCWLETQVHLVRDAEGRPCAMVGTSRDVTARREAVHALARREAQLRLAIEGADIGVISFHASTRRMAWSRELRDILGVTVDGASQQEFRAMIHPEDRSRVVATFDGAQAIGGGYSMEFRIVRPGGDVRWVSARGEFHAANGTDSARAIGTISDITERKSAELALQAQNRVLERIATGAPLAAVLEDIVAQVESQVPDARCSILVMDATRTRLRVAVGPSLPDEYHRAIDGMAISASAGSCGTAATLGTPISAPDVHQDPRWAPFLPAAEPHGLAACFSQPIVVPATDEEADALRETLASVSRFGPLADATPGPVVAANGIAGTFAIYRRVPGEFDAGVERALAGAAYLAGVAIARDVATRGLQASEERGRLLIEGARDYAMFLVGADGIVISWNDGAERIFGWTPAEAIGAHVDTVFPVQRGATPASEQLGWAARDGRYEEEGWKARRDGTQFWGLAVTTTLRHPDGSVRAFTRVVRDLTERRRLEDQLRQSQKMEAIGQLAGGVAHDFNNLLTVINGFSELLAAELPEAHHGQASVQAIREAGQRAAGLTRQLLAFSRKAIVEPRVVDLNDVVEGTSRMLRRLIGEDIAMELTLAPAVGYVRADPGQLEQVLVNLVVNARDAMPSGGRLTIATRDVTAPADAAAPDGRWVELSIADTGVGMSEEVRQRCFEPFFTTKGTGKGTGLGLSTVYGFVTQAGGRVSLESTPGAGTTFRVLFPRIASRGSTGPDADPEALPKGHEVILLVEDEDGVRTMTRRILVRLGYDVLAAGDAASAIELATAREGRVDLLLTDVVMPNGGGRVVAEALRERWPSIPVLYMSGYLDDAVLRHGIETAHDRLLQKPFTMPALARRVREVLDAARHPGR